MIATDNKNSTKHSKKKLNTTLQHSNEILLSPLNKILWELASKQCFTIIYNLHV